MEKNDVIYLLDSELAEKGYKKVGLTWYIDGGKYRLIEATANGFYFKRIDTLHLHED